jgi:leader peptidase (prepilin peptidase)/N-methyltransferase
VDPLLPVFALIGFLSGPALHHLAVRAGAREPFGRGLPACESCGTVRPVSRWFARPCLTCGAGPRSREWIVATLAAAAGAGAVLVADTGWTLPGYVVFAGVTVVLVVTDIDHKLIPNRILYPGTLAAGVLLAAGSAIDGELGSLWRGLGAGAAYFAVLYLVAVVARGGFGFGDVKLAFLLGLFTGFASFRVFLLAVFFTGVFGGVPAIVLLLSGRRGARSEMPYGPAMIAGAWVALLWGESFASLYL